MGVATETGGAAAPGRRKHAKPQSIILICPLLMTYRLAGLMSRCTRLRSWACCRPRAAWHGSNGRGTVAAARSSAPATTGRTGEDRPSTRRWRRLPWLFELWGKTGERDGRSDGWTARAAARDRGLGPSEA